MSEESWGPPEPPSNLEHRVRTLEKRLAALEELLAESAVDQEMAKLEHLRKRQERRDIWRRN